ncbi:MAG: hypothetical protein WCK08_06760 [Betaproteobacteria bacterium]
MASFNSGAQAPHVPSGHDLASLGPSDSSDSGSDSLGTRDRQMLASDTDAAGTGEGPSATGQPLADGADILPDHLVVQGPDSENDQEASEAWLDEAWSEQAELAIDVAGSALDSPDLLDTTADADQVIQDDAEPGAQDLDGFSQQPAPWQEPSGLPPLAGHRGLQ